MAQKLKEKTKLKKKTKAKRRSAPVRPVRFDASLNVKIERVKKAVLIQYARQQKRSVAFVVQGWLDSWIKTEGIELPDMQEADRILEEAAAHG